MVIHSEYFEKIKGLQILGTLDSELIGKQVIHGSPDSALHAWGIISVVVGQWHGSTDCVPESWLLNLGGLLNHHCRDFLQ